MDIRCWIFRRLSNCALALTSAVAMVLSQSPFELGALATVVLVPWLVTSSRSGPVEAVVTSIVMGVAYATIGTPWLLEAFRSQGVDGLRGVFGVLAVALWGKGLLFGLIGWLVWRLRGRSDVVRIIVPAALFGLMEHWISTSSLGLPLLFLGHSQHSIPGVMQFALVTGVPGISAFLFAVNAAFASVLLGGRPGGVRAAAAWVAAWLVIAIAGLPTARVFAPAVQSSPKTMLVVQPHIRPVHRWDAVYQRVILDEVAAETSRALMEVGRSPDAILWPENLLTLPTTQDNELGRRLRDYVNHWETPVVTGLVRGIVGGDVNRYRNSAVWWSPEGGERDAIDKVRAIPLVESSRVFWGRGLLARMLGETARGQRVEEAQVARPLRGEFTLSTVLCFEVLFPEIVAARRDDESVAIVNLADDSWVPGEVVDAQLVAAAAFRAVEQRLTLIRVSHGGLSVVIDRYGRTIASLEPNTVAHLFVEVSAGPKPSSLEKTALLMLPMTAGWLAWNLFPLLQHGFTSTRTTQRFPPLDSTASHATKPTPSSSPDKQASVASDGIAASFARKDKVRSS